MAAHHFDWSQSCDTERPWMPWPNNNGRLRAFKKLWSSQKLWHIQGEALEAYLTIETAIYNALQAYDVLHEGCRVYQQILGFECFMTGDDPGNVRPCIFIYCREKGSLARSRDAVRENQVWQTLRAQYPGCFNVQPVLGKPAVYLGRHIAQETQATEVLYDPSFPWSTYGCSIHFKRSQKWVSGVLGGFVVADEKLYGLTVAHCIHECRRNETSDTGLETPEAEDLSDADLDLLFPPSEQSSGPANATNESYYRSSFDVDSGVSIVSAMSIISTDDPEGDESDRHEFLQGGEAPDEFSLEVPGHFDQLQTSTEDAAHWALIKITSRTFLSHFERQTPDNLEQLEHVLHMRLETRPKSCQAITSDIFLWISGTEHPGFLNQCPSLVRLPGHQNLLRLRQVTVPILSFRKPREV